MSYSSPHAPNPTFKSNSVVVQKIIRGYSQEQRYSHRNEDEGADLEKALAQNMCRRFGEHLLI